MDGDNELIYQVIIEYCSQMCNVCVALLVSYAFNIIISSVQLIACLRIRRKIKVAPKEQKSDNENNFTVVK